MVPSDNWEACNRALLPALGVEWKGKNWDKSLVGALTRIGSSSNDHKETSTSSSSVPLLSQFFEVGFTTDGLDDCNNSSSSLSSLVGERSNGLSGNDDLYDIINKTSLNFEGGVN